MIIIYYDVGGSHSVQVTAGIRLGIPPSDRIPGAGDMFKMKKYDRTTKKDYGKINYIGADEFGNCVYTLSCQYASPVVLQAIRDMYQICGGNPRELLFISTLKTINLLMKIGGLTSRRLGFIRIGRPLVARGTLKAYPQIARIVDTVKKDIVLSGQRDKTDTDKKVTEPYKYDFWPPTQISGQ